MRGHVSGPPSASHFSCATVRENFKSIPRHASSSPRTFNQKQTWSKRWGGGGGGGARTHAQRSSAPPALPPPQAPPATWTVSRYELTREESWLHCNRAKPHTSSLLLIVLNQIHAVPSYTHTHTRDKARSQKTITYNDLLDTMWVKITCVLTVYEKKKQQKNKPNKIKETMRGSRSKLVHI